MHELEHIVTKSVLCNLTDGRVEMAGGAALQAKYPGKLFLMGEDPRLPRMPEKPTLIDYFRCRFASATTCCRARRSRSRTGTARRSCWPASCTTLRSSASSAAITAIGARR